MQNNESKESLNDDFWKIMSDSDEDASGIDMILRSKGNKKSSGAEASASEEFVTKDESEMCRDGNEEPAHVSIGTLDKSPVVETGNTIALNSGAGVLMDEQNNNVPEGFRGRNEASIISSRERKDDKGDDLRPPSMKESLTPRESSRMSVDEMGLWDDSEEEEFMIGRMNQMNVRSNECADVSSGIEENLQKKKALPEAVVPSPHVPEMRVSDDISMVSNAESILEPSAECIDTSCSSELTTPQETKFDPLKAKPVSKFVCGNLITALKTSQKRFNIQGKATQNDVNLTQWYRINYELPEIKPSSFLSQLGTSADDRYVHVYKLVQLKDPHVEGIMDIISETKPIYAHTGISNRVDGSNINEFVDLCFKSEDRAFEYAMKNEMWAFALLLPRRGREAVAEFINRFCDPSYVPFLSSVLDISPPSLKLSEDWRKYMRQLLSVKNSVLVHDFILQVSDRSIPDALFVTLSCHFLRLIDINQYLWIFSKNFEALRILCYVEYCSKCIEELDLFKYEFISVGIEFDKAKAEEYFNMNKKCFRRELSDNLRPLFDTRWSFGFKSVFDFGLKKILDVDDATLESERSDVKVESERSDAMPVAEGTKTEPSPFINAKAPIQGSNIGSASILSAYESGNGEVVEDTNGKKMYSLPRDESVPSNCAQQEEQKKLCVNALSSGSRETNGLYAGNHQSKSFADFFNSDKPEKEIRSEDDTSLFLSKFTENDVPEKADKPAIKTGSFFGFLNMFKKEPVHKVRIDSDDDFKYDPVSKKWISTSTNGNTENSPVLKPQAIPMPILRDRKPNTGNFDVDEMSVYAGRKSAGNRSIPGALNKKN